MTVARYSCSQPVLYKACKKVLQNLDAHLEQFSGFKGKYTEAYLSLLMEQLGKAEQLTGYQELLKRSEIQYQQLHHLSSDCTALWGRLKRYILAAFPENEKKAKLQEAGQNYYKKAVAKNWNSTNALLMAAKHFMQTHMNELTGTLNMPADFPEKFSNAYLAFSKGLLNFRQSEREIRSGTLLKIAANNDLFEKITEICQDGRVIFRQQPAVREQFVFNTLIKNIMHPVRNELHRSDTQVPPEYAQIQIIQENGLN